MLITVLLLFHDLDTRLRVHGAPTRTWSVGKPVYDLEYADDILLRRVTYVGLLNLLLKALQVEATLYAIKPIKTEHLPHPQASPQALYFANGDPCAQADSSKYLGTKVSWDSPSKIAIEDRKKQSSSSMYETAATMVRQSKYSHQSIKKSSKPQTLNPKPSFLLQLTTSTPSLR